MARYVASEEKYRRRKRRKAQRTAAVCAAVMGVLVVSFGIVKVIELFSHDEEEIPLLDNSRHQTEETKTDKAGFEMGPYMKDLDKKVKSPDIDVLAVTENGRVDISYFDDAMFLGDSLADGFKVYTTSLDLKNSTAVYLTQKSTTPRTFLQPGAQVDAGAGLIDVWATIEQRQPGKMYITLGTNALMGMEPEAFVESYGQLIDKIRDYTPDTLIYVTTITPTTYKTATTKTQLSFERIYTANNLLAKMCNEKGCALINLYDVLKNSSGYLREEISAYDGIHLTPTGYRQWLDYLVTHTVYDEDSPYIPGSPYYETLEFETDKEQA
ncbi:MAG: hypothetical protein IJD80_02465 [Oscillospiraceae bacterium]|nr:hypothetical protein [Oscillospiraceae bacterium]